MRTAPGVAGSEESGTLGVGATGVDDRGVGAPDGGLPGCEPPVGGPTRGGAAVDRPGVADDGSSGTDTRTGAGDPTEPEPTDPEAAVGTGGTRAGADAATGLPGTPGAPGATALWITAHDSPTAVDAAASQPATKRIPRFTPAFCSRSPALRTVRGVAALLLVEDDPWLRRALVHDLTDRGHVVRSAPTALDALRDVAAHPPDLVVLDLGLPDLDGAHALTMIRGLRADVPVIIASARDSDVDVVRLLHAGADDYLVKPFTSEQLHARVTAVLRRAVRPDPAQPLTVGELSVDPLRREVRLGGRELQLTRREFDLLAYLAARPGQVVTRRELLAEVWEHAYGQDQTIDVHLSLVRRKLGETAGAPRYLHTVRGVGVRLSAPPDDQPDDLPAR